MKNYKITFRLKSPICFTTPPLFDGILAYAYAKDVLPETEIQTGRLNIENVLDFSPMPLKIHPDGWFYGSWMFFDEVTAVEHTGSWKKRWANEHDELADFGKQKRKVRVNAGQFKSYDMPLRLVDVGECWFFFRSDNVEEVRRLIEKHVPALGKKASQGNGLISGFEIEPVDFDPFEKIIRPIPLPDAEVKNIQPGWAIAFTSWHPPYWLPKNFSPCRIK